MTPLPETPLVSVVTPSYNTGRYIEETLRSVQAQDYPRLEHLVLDSESSDQTGAVLARFPDVRLIRPGPTGLVQKMNLGFPAARGEIVAWLCADDYYLPGTVRKAVEILKRHPQVAVVYANDLLVDERSVEIQRVRSRQTSHSELVHHRNWLPHPTVFIRREALACVGPLDDRYPLVCDWDLWIRLSQRFPILFVDDWWAAFRVHADQRSNRYKYQAWQEACRMTRGHGASYFSPHTRHYWGRKLAGAGALFCRGELSVLGAKLRELMAAMARP